MNTRVINSNVGFGYPFGFAANGRTKTAGGSAYTRPTVQDMNLSVGGGVQQVALTERGERLMQPNLGVGAARFLFSPLGSRLSSILRSEFATQVQLFCPRCQVDVQSVIIDSAQGRIEVHGLLIHNSEVLPAAPFQIGVQR